jgi:hypothetical protein
LDQIIYLVMRADPVRDQAMVLVKDGAPGFLIVLFDGAAKQFKAAPFIAWLTSAEALGFLTAALDHVRQGKLV